jgi:TPR repeat protein
MGMQAKILSLYTRGCSFQDGGSCAQIGYALLGGEFALTAEGQWYDWLDRACKLDDWDGCYYLATRSVAQSEEALRWAAPLLDKACGKGHNLSCATYATWLASGTQVRKDCDAVKRIAARPCYENHADACAALGWCGHAQDHAFGKSVKRTSEDLLHEACQVGSAFACYHLAARLAGIEQPKAEALAAAVKQVTTDESRPPKLAVVLGRACDRGSEAGCLALALVWIDERTQAHQHSGLDLLRRLCDAGNGRACLHAGRAYEAGKIVMRDLTLANELLRLACREGEREACDTPPSEPEQEAAHPPQ